MAGSGAPTAGSDGRDGVSASWRRIGEARLSWGPPLSLTLGHHFQLPLSQFRVAVRRGPVVVAAYPPSVDVLVIVATPSLVVIPVVAFCWIRWECASLGTLRGPCGACTFLRRSCLLASRSSHPRLCTVECWIPGSASATAFCARRPPEFVPAGDLALSGSGLGPWLPLPLACLGLALADRRPLPEVLGWAACGLRSTAVRS